MRWDFVIPRRAGNPSNDFSPVCTSLCLESQSCCWNQNKTSVYSKHTLKDTETCRHTKPSLLLKSQLQMPSHGHECRQWFRCIPLNLLQDQKHCDTDSYCHLWQLLQVLLWYLPHKKLLQQLNLWQEVFLQSEFRTIVRMLESVVLANQPAICFLKYIFKPEKKSRKGI